jgi:hypothetical protein
VQVSVVIEEMVPAWAVASRELRRTKGVMEGSKGKRWEKPSWQTGVCKACARALGLPG